MKIIKHHSEIPLLVTCLVLFFSKVSIAEISQSASYKLQQANIASSLTIESFSSYQLSGVIGQGMNMGNVMVSNNTLFAGVMPYLPLLDSDADGVVNSLDAFPFDSSETLDSDNDGVGDNSDAFPFDGLETADNDLDGIGDNADLDDDNDGIPDSFELLYGFNPLVDDAEDDLDDNGISNLQEYLNSLSTSGYQVMKLKNGKVIVLPE